MPIVTVKYQGEHQVDVPEGTRLVHAVKQAGVEIGHRCGGHARCTTCRVEIEAGEPEKMTEAEAERLGRGDVGDVRLACQIAVEGDMTVIPGMVLQDQDWSDAGPEPEKEITPEPVWTTKTAATES